MAAAVMTQGEDENGDTTTTTVSWPTPMVREFEVWCGPIWDRLSLTPLWRHAWEIRNSTNGFEPGSMLSMVAQCYREGGAFVQFPMETMAQGEQHGYCFMDHTTSVFETIVVDVITHECLPGCAPVSISCVELAYACPGPEIIYKFVGVITFDKFQEERSAELHKTATKRLEDMAIEDDDKRRRQMEKIADMAAFVACVVVIAIVITGILLLAKRRLKVD